MKFFHKAKDGGPYSTVTGYWLAEIKSLFSVALLKFEDGSRESYHSHAFNSISWVLSGKLCEEHLGPGSSTVRVDHHTSGLRPVLTRRRTFHRVFSEGTSWVLTFRGPWVDHWHEFNPAMRLASTLMHGRRIVWEAVV